MQPEPPVVLGGGWLVDDLLGRGAVVVARAQRHHILDGEDGPHRGAGEVRRRHADRDVGRACGGRGGRAAAQRVEVETLATLRVRLVPRAQGLHVMARGRRDHHVGVRPWVVELLALLAGHALDAQTHQPQLLHDGRHARGHKPQVLAAHQHVARGLQHGQLGQRAGAPHLLLAPVVVVVVQPGQRVARVLRQLLVAAGGHEVEPGVEPVGVLGVGQQHHVLAQRHEPRAHRGRLLQQPGRRVLAHLDVLYGALTGVLRAQAVHAAALPLLHHVLGRHLLPQPLLEQLGQQVAPDVRLREAGRVVQAPAVQLVAPDGHGGAEVAQHARGAVAGDLPDAEEAQHVVDTVRVEVLRHVAQPPLPPLVVVGRHGLPRVRGEAPVLTLGVKDVGRRARGLVHAEEVRLNPGVHAALVHANGQVALEHHAGRLRGARHLQQLAVQVVLHVVREQDGGVVVRVRRGEAVERLLAGRPRQRAPLPVLRGREHVAEVRKGGVWAQPHAVGRHPLLELVALRGLGAEAVKHLARELALELHSAFVVDLPQALQLRLGGIQLVLQV
mmetsp:Transcript_18343/g.46334  ORF Transcript_18343/g.46334 Transcript_18343/m.46334 type:complete len:556 (-) Transcript_18343:554-2221(-)